MLLILDTMSSSQPSPTLPPPNEIYQYSLISALMSGLASPSSSIPVSTLLSYGTFGIGTFAHMDGEMVILDSVPYQFRSDGSTRAVNGDELIPFAMVSNFEAQITVDLDRIEEKGALEGEIEKCIGEKGRNAFVLFKLSIIGQGEEGVQGKGFKKVKIRAVAKQTYEGQPLSELTESQMIKKFENVRGTVVGVRSPGWSTGVSVKGMHMHFIDEQRKSGGHVLELSTNENVRFEVAVVSRFTLDLPRSEEFGRRELELDELGIKKAEG